MGLCFLAEGIVLEMQVSHSGVTKNASGTIMRIPIIIPTTYPIILYGSFHFLFHNPYKEADWLTLNPKPQTLNPKP